MQPDFRSKVALFGGSFDPLHEGHLHVAREARKALGAFLLFVPAGQSPGKPAPRAPGELRLSWLESACRGEIGWGAWDVELRRPGASYTVDTLKEAHRLGAARDRLYWVVGADAHAKLSTWKEPALIRALCRLVVVGRPGSNPGALEADDLFLPLPPHPASSTAIRQELAEGRLSVPGLPAFVADELRKLTLLSQNPYARKKE